MSRVGTMALGLAAFAGGLAVGRSRYARRLTRQVRFSIALYEGPDPFHLAPMPGVPLPLLRPEDLDDIHAEFVADPFLHREPDWSWRRQQTRRRKELRWRKCA